MGLLTINLSGSDEVITQLELEVVYQLLLVQVAFGMSFRKVQTLPSPLSWSLVWWLQVRMKRSGA